ncbi:peroxisomal membrane protein PEX13-like [Artemia franciscana]|uniref:peroxisomal membrane protein PEX13-like n=1 Tax=Artemia franciscana TaxID=6661 RepID=UPI0032DAC894
MVMKMTHVFYLATLIVTAFAGAEAGYSGSPSTVYGSSGISSHSGGYGSANIGFAYGGPLGGGIALGYMGSPGVSSLGNGYGTVGGYGSSSGGYHR